jgi:hypothetical protein
VLAEKLRWWVKCALRCRRRRGKLLVRDLSAGLKRLAEPTKKVRRKERTHWFLIVFTYGTGIIGVVPIVSFFFAMSVVPFTGGVSC